ncbi:PEP-CTERM sorting domain-containing protein [Hassallia byssoidea VB512170]|uniref:PEP-CTERM sorting domain-containing protein n=1 Tax=Hassallia byssoidea VB512170 TaxID=1304833 RepID=A0A846HBY7_9CYAN|nr:PEP-CTERM sorting domain-containing protein [Hassalia byssoidea]NEU74902.1 PEP-CTERM sorting domain-containing protein [Hassalia byssoidea VB512170]
MFIRKFASIAALSLGAIASFSYADAAHAMTFTMSTGTTGPNGETNQGAYTKDKNAITIDFNDTKNEKGKTVQGKAPTTGFAQYSFSNANGQKQVGSNSWAPTGPDGEKNTSKYLQVMAGNSVTITLESLAKSFGLDWGAAHPGNTLSFFNGSTLIKTFITADIGKFALYSKFHPGPKADGAIKLDDGKYYQGNGYVEFFAENSNEYFNKIVISQQAKYGGGFESDNHSFRTVPEPSLALGMLAIGGGMFLRKRKNQKSLNLG